MSSRTGSPLFYQSQQLSGYGLSPSGLYGKNVRKQRGNLGPSVTLLVFSAHAGLSPWEGKNALDAAVLAYTNIGLLRQQIKPTHRVHGVFGGEDWAPNGPYYISLPHHRFNQHVHQ